MVKTLRMYNIWNFRLSICTLLQHKSYISKGIPPIFEIFGSARRCWGRAFGWKDSGSQLFYFCNGKVKTLRMYNISNFPLSIRTLSQQKSHIPKGIQPIFVIFASARRCWGRAFRWKVWSAQVYFCNGKVKTLRIDNIWNFATFNLYTPPAKILYLQSYSTDFQNLFLSSKIMRVGIRVESFRRAGILLLQWQGENFAHVQHLKFANFRLYTVPAKILYLQRYSTDFRNLCHSAKMLRVCIWVESFKRAGILLLQWQGENLANVQYLKFPTFNLYTVTAKILYLQRYSTDFRNLWLSSKMLREGICVERFKRAGILLLQWQGDNLAHVQHLKFPTFNLYTFTAKILYFQRYSTDFRNLCFSSKMLTVGICVENFRCVDIVLLNGKVKTLRIDNIWNFPLSNCRLSWQKSYISYGIQPIFEIFASARRFCWRAVGGKFQARRYGTFAMARRKFCACTTIQISHFQPVYCASKNPTHVSPKVFNRFSKS